MTSENICLKFTLGLQILQKFLPSGSNASTLPSELKGGKGCKFKLYKPIQNSYFYRSLADDVLDPWLRS